MFEYFQLTVVTRIVIYSTFHTVTVTIFLCILILLVFLYKAELSSCCFSHILKLQKQFFDQLSKSTEKQGHLPVNRVQQNTIS